MLKAIFYARFHAERGPSVIHQHPPSSIITSVAARQTLVSWSNITSYIIPPYDLCNQSLSICTESHRVLAFPISIEDVKYERNRFTFNVCFVLSENEDARPWEHIVRKTATFFETMEMEDGLLSAEESLSGLKWAGEAGYHADKVGIVQPLLESIFEHLNAYAECSARVDDLHVLNLRLVPSCLDASPTLPKIHSWDVPLLIRPLPDPREWTWDLTLRRIQPFLDGVRHIRRIAELADAEPKLVKHAVAELVVAGRATLLDLFHFSAIYTCTSSLPLFLTSPSLLSECRAYVHTPPSPTASSSLSSPPTDSTLITLYTSLTPGLPLSTFAQTYKCALQHLDLRRLITFGLLKGFLRRIHRYALAIDTSPGTSLQGPGPGPSPFTHRPASASHPASSISPNPSAGEELKVLNAALESSSSNPRDPLTRSSAASTVNAPGSGSGAGTTALGTTPRSGNASLVVDENAALREFDRAWKRAALSSGWATPPSGPPPTIVGLSASLGGKGAGAGSQKSAEQVRSEEDRMLRGYLDGRHCLDRICVEMRWSERRVLERIRSGRFGEVVVFHR